MRGTGGAYPRVANSSARCLGVGQYALAIHRDVVALQPGIPSLRASCADVETFAIAMVSKACFIASIISTDSPRPCRTKLPALSTARSSISLQPPPPGSRPTPTSTSPM